MEVCGDRQKKNVHRTQKGLYREKLGTRTALRNTIQKSSREEGGPRKVRDGKSDQEKKGAEQNGERLDRKHD